MGIRIQNIGLLTPFRVNTKLLGERIATSGYRPPRNDSFLTVSKCPGQMTGAFYIDYNLSTSLSQIRAEASLGIRQSPRGLRLTPPVFTPSGAALRLNCWVKKRR